MRRHGTCKLSQTYLMFSVSILYNSTKLPSSLCAPLLYRSIKAFTESPFSGFIAPTVTPALLATLRPCKRNETLILESNSMMGWVRPGKSVECPTARFEPRHSTLTEKVLAWRKSRS